MRAGTECESEPLRKMESHAHKGTTRAIVSIGAGHGKNGSRVTPLSVCGGLHVRII